MQLHQLLLICIPFAIVSSQSCPSYDVGLASGVLMGSRRDPFDGNVYLNLREKAQCSGVVVEWRYCFIPTTSPQPLELVLAAYRPLSNGSYQLVPGSRYNLELYGTFDTIICNSITLQPNEYFTLQENDVVAFCEEFNVNRVPIYLSETGNSVWRWDAGGCSKSQISITGTLTRMADRVFMLSAHIDPNECEDGTHNCDENADCLDIVGGFECQCKNGYVSDGNSSCMVMGSGDDMGMEEEMNSTETNSTMTNSTMTNDTVVDNGPMENNMTMTNETGTNETMVPEEINNNSTDSNGTNSDGTGNEVENNNGITENNTTNMSGGNMTMGGNGDQNITGSGEEETGSNGTGGNAGRNATGTTNLQLAIFIVLTLLLFGAMAAIAILVTLLWLRKRSKNRKGQKTIEPSPEVLSPLSSMRRTPLPDNVYGVLESNPYSPTSSYDNRLRDSLGTSYQLPADHLNEIVDDQVHEYVTLYEEPAKEENDLYTQIASYDMKVIPRGELEIVSHLGSGQFGRVSKAEWRMAGNRHTSVAVKTLTDSANTVKFLQEAAIMAQFKHPNILTLYGVVSAGHPKMIVMELMQNGNLKNFLTKMRPDPGQLLPDLVPKQLLDFSKQVALGLHYLSCRGFVHRDLAARNILVSNMCCKIADFGMSRDLADDDIYVSHGGVIPVRWTAPEAISHKKYSTASDVWSYGCVLYEIWSLGHKPFENISVDQILQVVDMGHRLSPPPGCPRRIYQLMIATWHQNVNSRPEPRDLVKRLLGAVDEVLAIPPEDVPANSQAAILGAPLDQGSGLYQDLQNTYI